MTTKKSVEIVEMLLRKKTNLKQDLSKSENNWGTGVAGQLVQLEIKSLINEIRWLEILKKEIAPDCKHPPEMHDICKGQKYCMACNMDL